MDIAIYLEDVKEAVKRQLSIIGKHHSTQKGDTLFSVSTLSSVEDTVMRQCIIDGAQLVTSNLSPVLSGYEVGKKAGGQKAEYIAFVVNTDALSGAAQDSVKSLLIAYVTQSVLAMVLPDLAGKYATDVQAQLLAATRLIFTKTPPGSADKTLADCVGSVEL